MNTVICDCGRLHQISFQVAVAILGQCSSAVPLHMKQVNGECRGNERIIIVRTEVDMSKKVMGLVVNTRPNMIIKGASCPCRIE